MNGMGVRVQSRRGNGSHARWLTGGVGLLACALVVGCSSDEPGAEDTGANALDIEASDSADGIAADTEAEEADSGPSALEVDASDTADTLTVETAAQDTDPVETSALDVADGTPPDAGDASGPDTRDGVDPDSSSEDAADVETAADSAAADVHDAGASAPTFGVNGAAVLPFSLTPYRILFGPDGGLILASVSTSGSESAFVAVTAEGALDSGFADAGILQFDFDTGAFDAAVDRDGKLLVSGMNLDAEATVWRFLPDGTPDSEFDSDLGGMIGLAESVQLDGGGNLRVIGNSLMHSPSGYIFGLLPDGTPDRSFGSDGLTWVGRSLYFYWMPLPDGGWLGRGGQDSIRLSADGVVDPAFSLTWDGISLNRIAWGGDGFWVTGHHPDGAGFIERRNLDGGLDASFAVTELPDVSAHPVAVAVDASGRLELVVASRLDDSVTLLRLARDGKVDASIPIGESADAYFATAATAPDGMLYIAFRDGAETTIRAIAPR